MWDREITEAEEHPLHVLNERVQNYTEAINKLNEEIKTLTAAIATDKEKEAEAARLKADPELAALTAQLSELKTTSALVSGGAPITPSIMAIVTGSASPAASPGGNESSARPNKIAKEKAKEPAAPSGAQGMRERARKDKLERLSKLSAALERAVTQLQALSSRTTATTFFQTPSYAPCSPLPSPLLKHS